MRTPITGHDLQHLFAGMRRSAFRLETLPQYLVESEAEAFAAFRDGSLLPPPRSEEQTWWDEFVSRQTREGKSIARVRFLPPRLTPYLRFEIDWGYVFTATAGEDIRLLDSVTAPSVPLADDFWLLDDSTIIFLAYDADGRLLRFDRDDDASVVAQAVETKNRLMEAAEPLRDFLRRLREADGNP